MEIYGKWVTLLRGDDVRDADVPIYGFLSQGCLSVMEWRIVLDVIVSVTLSCQILRS